VAGRAGPAVVGIANAIGPSLSPEIATPRAASGAGGVKAVAGAKDCYSK